MFDIKIPLVRIICIQIFRGFKKRLITNNSQDSDPSSKRNLGQMIKGGLQIKAIFIIALLVMFSPVSLHAGFFTLGIFFGDNTPQIEEPKIEKTNLNSQNIPLLQSAINLDPDPAKGGADINTIENTALIVESGVGGGFVEIRERKNDQISVYEVKPGDTISQIAEMFEISPNTIRWANDFEGAIQPGQKLVILPISGITHTVKSGGTVSDIAEIYNADAREIALFNGIKEDQYLEKGQTVIVPNVEPEIKSTPSNNNHNKNDGHDHSSDYAVESWMIRPIDGGYRSQGIHGYNGVDLANKIGTPIYAAASGKVIVSKQGGWNGGYGSYIVIEHSNGVQTLYAHNSSNIVKMGQWVKQGQLIGYVGNTGRSTGAHLHFEVRGGKNPF